MRRRRTKKNLRKRFRRLLGGFGLLTASLIFCYFTLHSPASVPPRSTPFSILSHFPLTEMPAQAASLVHAAAGGSQTQVTIETIRAVTALARPGLIPYTIRALCHENPEMAGIIISNTVVMETDDKYIYFTVGAAVAGAPQKAEAIALAACQAKPRWFCDIALAVAKYSTLSNSVIIRALVEGLPTLQPFFDMAEIRGQQLVTHELTMPEILGLTVDAIKDSGQTIDSLVPTLNSSTNNAAFLEPSPPVNIYPDVDLLTNLNQSQNQPTTPSTNLTEP